MYVATNKHQFNHYFFFLKGTSKLDYGLKNEVFHYILLNKIAV